MADVKKIIFCAAEQEEKTHFLDLSPNGKEVIATCECGRSLKFPASTPDEFNALIVAHKQANIGQITKEMQDKKLKELVGEDKPQE